MNLKDGLENIYSFIVTILITAMKGSPTKRDEQREREVYQFKDEVWSRVYSLLAESLVVDEDDDGDYESVDIDTS